MSSSHWTTHLKILRMKCMNNISNFNDEWHMRCFDTIYNVGRNNSKYGNDYDLDLDVWTMYDELHVNHLGNVKKMTIHVLMTISKHKHKTSVYDATPLRRNMRWYLYDFMLMTMIISKCVGVMSLRYPRQGDTRGSRQGGRDQPRKGGPHDTKGVWCTLARFSSVLYGDIFRGYSTRDYSVKWTKKMLFVTR